MKTLRIVIVDDNEAVRRSLTSLVEARFEIAAVLGDGEELLAVIDELDADVVLLDVSMPGIDGIAAAHQLRERGCPAAIVFVSVHGMADIVESALGAGAKGYVLKSRADRDLIPAIESAAEGCRFVSPPLSGPGKDWGGI